MKALIVISTFIVSVCAQDILIDLSGNEVVGELHEITDTHIVFLHEGNKTPQRIPLNAVYMVRLNNGTVAFSQEDRPEFIQRKQELEEKRRRVAKELLFKKGFHGNKTSMFYHSGNVNHLPPDSLREFFETEEAAKLKGYSPCIACFDMRPALSDYYLEKELVKTTIGAIQTYNEILYEHPDLPKLTEMVNSILDGWAETLKGYDYRILVIRDEDPNAFAVAGGHLYISSGLLKMIEDENELIFILAHEIAHVERRHTLRQFKELQVKKLATAFLTTIAGAVAATAGKDAGDIGFATDLTSAFGEFGILFAMRGYGRELEQEADIFAQLYLDQHGYGEEGMTRTLDKLATHSSKRGMNITANAFSDHPGLVQRINQVKDSEMFTYDQPMRIFVVPVVPNVNTVISNALLEITGQYIHKAPSSNRKNRDVITLIGSISNLKDNQDYQIDKMQLYTFDILGKNVFLKNMKGLPIPRSATIDFATSFDVPQKHSGILVQRLLNKATTPYINISAVELKKGKGASKTWGLKSLPVVTIIQ